MRLKGAVKNAFKGIKDPRLYDFEDPLSFLKDIYNRATNSATFCALIK